MNSKALCHVGKLQLVAVLLVGLIAPPLAAAEPDARALYEQGAQAYREARYEAAIDLFLRSLRLEPHAELNYDLGRAYEGAGNLARAIASFREYLRLEPSAKDRAVIEARVENLERRLSAAQPRVTVTSNPEGATVAIDDRVVGTTPYAGSVGPGAHRVDVRRTGHVPLSRAVKLGEGQQTELHLDLEPVAPSTASAAPPAEPERGMKVSLPAWIALGVGVGALGTALGFELARRSAEDDAKSARTQLGHQESYRVAEKNRDFARVFLGIGAAATLTSGVLVYLDMSSERSAGPTVGFIGSGRF